MVLSTSLFLLTLGVAWGFPTENAFIEPSSADSRGPCPGLNTAANHGFLDRSGFNVTVDEMKEQLSTIYPVDIDFLDVPINAAIRSGIIFEAEDGTLRMNLGDLSRAKVMEHDASFFRVDSFFGDKSLQVDNRLVTRFFRIDRDRDDFMTQDDILKFQTERLRNSLRFNPEASFSDGDIFAMSEQATFLLMMGQEDDLGSVRKDILRDWVVDNKFHEDFAVSPSFTKLTFDGDIAEEVLLRFTHNIEEILDCDLGWICNIGWLADGIKRRGFGN